MYAFTLGLQLDDNQTGFRETRYPTIGPNRLLQVLEQFLGLSVPPDDIDHLRLAAYRTALERGLREFGQPPFYQSSFQADQIGTAATLLERRDELLQSGFRFEPEPDQPDRLQRFALLEPFFQEALRLYERPMPGRADRLIKIIHTLPHRKNPIDALQLLEPRDLWPKGWQRLFIQLEDQNTQFSQLPVPTGRQGTDLDTFRDLVWSRKKQHASGNPLQADGSLLVLRADRDAELSPWLSKWLKLNPDYRPALLVPEQQSQAESYLILEGLPAIGLSTTSPSRPGQQALKLVPAFIWEPVNPFQVLEFLNLSQKPLDTDLSRALATAMGKSPGLGSQEWKQQAARFFGRLAEKEKSDPRIDTDSVRLQYRTWFERKRYPEQEPAPVEEILPLFTNLFTWAYNQIKNEEKPSPTLMALAGQAQRMQELLQTHPRPIIFRLELEQLIRAVYEGTPMIRNPAEAGAQPIFVSSAGIPFPIDQVIWWSFLDQESDPFFSRWYQTEREYLVRQGISLIQPSEESKRLLFQQKWPLGRVQRQLVLVLPRTLAGTDVNPHPVYAMLKASFDDLSTITLDLNKTDRIPPVWTKRFQLPGKSEQICRELPAPRPFIQLRHPDRLLRKPSESFSSLEALLYYPYKWLFRDQLALYPSAMVSIPEEKTLKGNLSHRVFERLLETPDILSWERDAVQDRVESISMEVLQQEGSVFLMYGKEPDRVRFIRQLQEAGWMFIHTLRESGWEIAGVEESLSCPFADLDLRGRLDLRLQRGKEQAIVDLKWGGKQFREDLLRNHADLQLVLYSRMASPDRWPDTAYFIIRSCLWLTRSEGMFKGVLPVTEGANNQEIQQSTWEGMEKTYGWRKKQLEKGQIEIRCAQTLLDLEEAYGEELLDLLELPNEHASFDDYGTLIRQFE